MFSFNRAIDANKIQALPLDWNNIISWTDIENQHFNILPEYSGVYVFIFTIDYKNFIYNAGITNSIRRRLKQHRNAFYNGQYTILDMNGLNNKLRKEIWHGWQYAKEHKDEFIERKLEIQNAVKNQLENTKISFCRIDDLRIKERIEYSLMYNIYNNTEWYSDIMDRGTFIHGRLTYEIPIRTINRIDQEVIGIPSEFEI
jgi:predicted GIY-YIG superfamily endonuclease